MMSEAPDQGDDPNSSQFSLTQQLADYETHSRLSEQVIGYLGHLGTFANLFMIATGAIWVVLAPNTFNLADHAVLAALVLHIVLCCAILYVILGMAKAIRQRLEFATELGERFYPDIEKIGKETSNRISTGLYKLPRLGGPGLSWAVIPLIGIIGSLLIGLDEMLQARPQRTACEERWSLLLQATDRVQLDRARYLLDKGGCDLKMNLVNPSTAPKQ
jgi:hypothetical protein